MITNRQLGQTLEIESRWKLYVDDIDTDTGISILTQADRYWHKQIVDQNHFILKTKLPFQSAGDKVTNWQIETKRQLCSIVWSLGQLHVGFWVDSRWAIRIEKTFFFGGQNADQVEENPGLSILSWILLWLGFTDHVIYANFLPA